MTTLAAKTSELHHEIHEWKAAIFAYEMAGDTWRIASANEHLDALYAELRAAPRGHTMTPKTSPTIQEFR